MVTRLRVQRHTDLATGEIREVGVETVARRRGAKVPAFTAVFQEAAQALAISGPHLSPTEWRMLMLFLGLAPMGEPLVINQNRIAEVMGLNRATVCRAVAALVRHGLIVRDPTCSRCYWFDRELAWRGDFADRLVSA